MHLLAENSRESSSGAKSAVNQLVVVFLAPEVNYGHVKSRLGERVTNSSEKLSIGLQLTFCPEQTIKIAKYMFYDEHDIDLFLIAGKLKAKAIFMASSVQNGLAFANEFSHVRA